MGGGDYDGDAFLSILHPPVVLAFTEQPPFEPPKAKAKAFAARAPAAGASLEARNEALEDALRENFIKARHEQSALVGSSALNLAALIDLYGWADKRVKAVVNIYYNNLDAIVTPLEKEHKMFNRPKWMQWRQRPDESGNVTYEEDSGSLLSQLWKAGDGGSTASDDGWLAGRLSVDPQLLLKTEGFEEFQTVEMKEKRKELHEKWKGLHGRYLNEFIEMKKKQETQKMDEQDCKTQTIELSNKYREHLLQGYREKHTEREIKLMAPLELQLEASVIYELVYRSAQGAAQARAQNAQAQSSEPTQGYHAVAFAWNVVGDYLCKIKKLANDDGVRCV